MEPSTILVIIGVLIAFLFLLFLLIPKPKKKDSDWNIFERQPVSENDEHGWYSENKISKQISPLYPTKQELGRALFGR